MKEKLEEILKKAACSFAIGLSLFGAGCFNSDTRTFLVNSHEIKNLTECRPKKRLGSYPSSTIGTKFRGIDDLGNHGYKSNLSEISGIVYTKKAGHIDIYHARKSADWTAFLSAESFKNLTNGNTEFTFKSTEPGIYHVKLNYPENWKSLSENERQKVTRDVSIELGKYFTHQTDVWHEIITWFGYKSWGIFSEFPSAFSWEDSFSDVFGICIGEKALKSLETTKNTYDESVTYFFKQELEKLEIQPADVAKQVSKNLRGKWFSGNLPCFVEIKKRNLDVGLDDGYITPFVAPMPNERKINPPIKPLYDYPVPSSDISKYGFSVNLEIEPLILEKNKILEVVKKDKKLDVKKDFPVIIEYIRKDAIRMFGPGADKPE